MTDHDKYMKLAAEAARENIESGAGGPFGAAIVKDGLVIAVAANSVLADHDPTAHAEVNAIRNAAEILGTHDLSGCVIYATGYPCPMCMSAIIWANIETAFYALDVDKAAEIGFRDEKIYDFILGKDPDVLSIAKIDVRECAGLYDEYSALSCQMY